MPPQQMPIRVRQIAGAHETQVLHRVHMGQAALGSSHLVYRVHGPAAGEREIERAAALAQTRMTGPRARAQNAQGQESVRFCRSQRPVEYPVSEVLRTYAPLSVEWQLPIRAAAQAAECE